jgi:3-phosphoshikimate 1-carboxyvinyltransferase
MKHRVPSDKSLTHRALIVASLAEGRSILTAPLISEDTLSTIRVLRQLGVEIQVGADQTIQVSGRGGELSRPTEPLDCGNSGTTARLILGLLAGIGVPGIVTGDASLRSRPSRRVTEPLQKMGAVFEIPDSDQWPVTVLSGVTESLEYQAPIPSAQVKSAVLLAGLASGLSVKFTESIQTRDHTERLFQALGLDLTMDRGAISFRPGTVKAFEASIPGDPSSASFLFAAGLMRAVPVVVDELLLNSTRTGFLSVLKRMGAEVKIDLTDERLGEPVGSVQVSGESLQGTEIMAAEVPSLIDEVPILAVLASVANGSTRFEGVGELRVKESDRLERLAANLTALDVDVNVSADNLTVTGPINTPTKAVVETGGDHRIAMAFATLGTHPGVNIELSENGSHQVSFPDFYPALAGITA